MGVTQGQLSSIAQRYSAKDLPRETLSIAKVEGVNPEEMTVTLRSVGTQLFEHLPVPLTNAAGGGRHIIGALPEVGDLCIVGWLQNHPVILTWLPKGSEAAQTWAMTDEFPEDYQPGHAERVHWNNHPTRLKLKPNRAKGSIHIASSQGSELDLNDQIKLDNPYGTKLALKGTRALLKGETGVTLEGDTLDLNANVLAFTGASFQAPNLTSFAASGFSTAPEAHRVKSDKAPFDVQGLMTLNSQTLRAQCSAIELETPSGSLKLGPTESRLAHGPGTSIALNQTAIGLRASKTEMQTGTLSVQSSGVVSVEAANAVSISTGQVTLTANTLHSQVHGGASNVVTGGETNVISALLPTDPAQRNVYPMGGVEHTLLLGDLSNTLTVGNVSFVTGLGTTTFQNGPNNVTLSPVTGVSILTALGNTLVASASGTTTITSLTGTNITASAGPVTLASTQAIIMTAPTVAPNLGSVITSGSLDPLTGLPLATFGMGHGSILAL